MDPCDPCGGVIDQGCGYRRPWSPWSWGGFGRSYGACGCGSCGDCGMDQGFTGAGASYGYPASPSCGCGQSTYPDAYNANSPTSSYPVATPPTYVDGSNNSQSAPQLRSAPTPPLAPARSTEPPVIPGSESSMMSPPVGSRQPQMVSYEEFQRLPGTIISGPGATGASPMNNPSSQIQQISASNSQPFMAPPSPSTSSAPRPVSAGLSNKPNWLPAPPN
jgi:hypothetical protein